MHCHTCDKPVALIERNRNYRANVSLPICRKDICHSRVRLTVLDNVGLALTHKPRKLGAELGKGVGPDNTCDTTGVVPGQVENSFVIVNRSVSTAINPQRLAE